MVVYHRYIRIIFRDLQSFTEGTYRFIFVNLAFTHNLIPMGVMEIPQRVTSESYGHCVHEIGQPSVSE